MRDVGTIFLDRTFYLLMFSALAFGISNVTGKCVLDEILILYTHGLRMLGFGGILLIFTLRAASLNELKRFFLNRSPALLFVGINEFITTSVGLSVCFGHFRKVHVTCDSTHWRGLLREQLFRKAVLVKLARCFNRYQHCCNSYINQMYPVHPMCGIP